MAQASGGAALQSNIDSFNQLVGAARAMVQRLSTTSAGATSASEIADFQRAFTLNRGIMFDELAAMTNGAWQPASMVLELRNKGLTVDGKYGSRTGTALMLVMWARSGNVEAINSFANMVPTAAAKFPQYYVANRNAFDANLSPFSSGDVTTPAPIPTVPSDPIPTQPSVPPVITTPAPDDIDFGNDGSTVVGTGLGKMSFATVLAILLGVGVVGGFTWYGLKKSGKLPRFLRRR